MKTEALNILKEPDLLNLKRVFYNYSSAAGINYTVDVSKPAGDRVNIVELSNGTSFDFDNTYTVAINSYRGSGGGGHLTRGAGIPQDELIRKNYYLN